MARLKSNKPQQFCGTSQPCREYKPLIVGEGQYVADIVLRDPLHISFFRSPAAKAVISSCEMNDALDQKGVVAVFSGADVKHLGKLSVNPVLGDVKHMDFPVLASQELLHVGQPVAAVLAESQAEAVDAVEIIELDFEEADTQNQQFSPFVAQWSKGNVEKLFMQADHIVEVEIQHSRLAPSPMENRGIAVNFNPKEKSVTLWISSQTPHRAKSDLSCILGVEENLIRVISPDVGGAFGLKASLYPEEVFAVWAAFKLRRSVRWNSSRSEDFLAASHGRGAQTSGRMAVSSEGKFLALEAKVVAPVGSWLTNSSAIPAWNAARILPGAYNIEAYKLKTKGLRTDTAPVGIYRGAGRPEAAMLMEQLVDAAAAVLSIDPIEIRRKNLLSPDKLPHRRNTGATLDSGDYPAALEKLLKISNYPTLQKKQRKRQKRGELVGIGVGMFVEPCGSGWESATVVMNEDGTIVVKSGSSTQGHARKTTYAQIAADIFGCSMENITVLVGDTKLCPPGIGALASRSTAIGGSAVAKAAMEVVRLAGKIKSKDKPIEASVVYETEAEAWGYGVYLAQVAIDPMTGVLNIEQLYCVDDAGTPINPQLIEGQIHGGVAQGLGEALMESVIYDDDGQLLTGSFMDYALPRASDIPPLKLSHMQTPAPGNILGAKGVGEAGTIGTPAAIYNATINALSHLVINSLSLPLTSNTIWNALHAAELTKRNTDHGI